MFVSDLYNKICTIEILHNSDINILLNIMSDSTNQFFPKKRLSRKQYNIAKNP